MAEETRIKRCRKAVQARQYDTSLLDEAVAESLRRLGAMIERRRTQLRLTHAQLAVQSGTNEEIIKLLEQGGIDVDIDVFERVAMALGFAWALAPAFDNGINYCWDYCCGN